MLIMLTYDKPLLRGQPPLSSHLLVSEGGHLIEVYLYFLGSQMSLRIGNICNHLQQSKQQPQSTDHHELICVTV